MNHLSILSISFDFCYIRSFRLHYLEPALKRVRSSLITYRLLTRLFQVLAAATLLLIPVAIGVVQEYRDSPV